MKSKAAAGSSKTLTDGQAMKKAEPKKTKPAASKLSEIDDIFSGGKDTASKADAGADALSKETDGDKKRKKKKSKESPAASMTAEASGSAKAVSSKTSSDATAKPAVVVVDTASSTAVAAAPAAKKAKSSSAKSRKQPDEDRDAVFADSRGEKRARTEDGLRIFSAKELNISEEGGDTPLCPFDCECCF